MKRLVSNSIIIVLMLLSCYTCKNNAPVVPEIKLEGLTLNNNKKWKANEETHIGMQRIDSILKNYTSSNENTIGASLSQQTSNIIRRCNMTGEPHDQLHIVLVPILEEISEVRDTDNSKGLEKRILTLKSLTATYFKYFEI